MRISAHLRALFWWPDMLMFRCKKVCFYEVNAEVSFYRERGRASVATVL